MARLQTPGFYGSIVKMALDAGAVAPTATRARFWWRSDDSWSTSSMAFKAGGSQLAIHALNFPWEQKTVDLPGTGTIYTYTVVRHPLSPQLAAVVPYVSGVIELDGTQGAGARLLLSETATLPEKFDLHIPQKDRTYRAQLRWRREDGIGVTFDNGSDIAETAPDLTMTALLRRVGELEAENAALRRRLAQMMEPSASAI